MYFEKVRLEHLTVRMNTAKIDLERMARVRL